MRDRKDWSQYELDLLVSMVMSGEFTYNEIAEKLNRTILSVRIKSQILGMRNPTYRHRITKHKHLREPVMRYFVNHTAEETMKKFNLTESEFKSIFTVGYKDPKLKHLRKDKRRKDAWSSEELKFLLQHSGIKPRDWIAKKLKRGGLSGIKDRLDSLGIASRTLNGLTLSQYRQAFSSEPDFYIRTQAGPGNLKAAKNKRELGFYKIVPWVYLKEQIETKKLKTIPLMKKLIYAMAEFQDWIHEGKAMKNLIKISKEKKWQR